MVPLEKHQEWFPFKNQSLIMEKVDISIKQGIPSPGRARESEVSFPDTEVGIPGGASGARGIIVLPTKICLHCGVKLRRKNSLEAHLRVCKIEKLQCIHCSRRFKNKSGLSTHLKYCKNRIMADQPTTTDGHAVIINQENMDDDEIRASISRPPLELGGRVEGGKSLLIEQDIKKGGTVFPSREIGLEDVVVSRGSSVEEMQKDGPVSSEMLVKSLKSENKILVCEFCSKSCKSKSGLSNHLRYCKNKKRLDQNLNSEEPSSSEIRFSELAEEIMNHGTINSSVESAEVENQVSLSGSSQEIQRHVSQDMAPSSPCNSLLDASLDEEDFFASFSSAEVLRQVGQREDVFKTSTNAKVVFSEDNESGIQMVPSISSCEMMEQLGRRVESFASPFSSPVIPSPPSVFTGSFLQGDVDGETSFPTTASCEILGQRSQDLEIEVPLDGTSIRSPSPVSVGEGEESESISDAEEICKEKSEVREFKIMIDDDVCLPVKNRVGQVIQGSQCESCLKIYTSKRQLLVHHRQQPKCSGYALECEGCQCRFRNEQGLKQHVQRSDCGRTDLSLQTKSNGGASHVDAPRPLTRLDSSHVHDLHKSRSQAPVEKEKQALNSLPSRPNIQWPPMKDYKGWKKFETSVDKQLNKNAPLIDRLNNLVLIIQEEGKELFGVRECYENVSKPSFCRRARELANIRRKITNLTRKAANADSDDERGGILLVRCDLIEKKRKLRKAENSRKARWRKKRARQSFYNDPYKASREVLLGTNKTQLKVDKKVVDDYVADVAADPLRDTELGHLDGLPEARDPVIQFDESKFKYSVFKKILRRTRNASKPGLNGIPYKVYKKCPKLAQYLFSLLIGVLKSKKIPLPWRISDGVFIPKVDKAKETNINDFRQIALMNVEGKLFWSLVADRLYNYVVDDNNYIKTSSQKGSIRNMPGCWEHTSMVWNALRDARSSKKALVVLWLDLANAYGSVPHKLIEFALKRYKVPQVWIDLILDYYNGLWGRSGSNNIKSEWTRYEKGIFAGCTLSVILFLLAFNVIIEYVECGPSDKYILNGKAIEAVRGFMDDISLLVPSVPVAKVVLTRTDVVLKWARMALKPPKSRSVVVKRGKLQNVEPFSVDGVRIPGLQNKPLRTLGRVYDLSIDDKDYRTTIFNKFCNGLWKLDKSSFTGFMKAWALHHVLIKQIEWDFMIYEMSLHWIEAMQRKQNIFTRKWLGVAKNLSNVALYSNQVPCPLPFTSLITLFKKTKVRSYLQLCDSKDEQVSASAKPHYTGLKWKVGKAIGEAESRVRMSRIIGEVRGVKKGKHNDQSARAGLGFGSFSVDTPPEGSKESRKELVDTLDECYEEQLLAEATNLSFQGAWMTWKGFIQRDLSWKSVLFGKSELTRFCLGATYETLATPSNLKLWNIVEESSCYLCGDVSCNIRHILSSCRIAQAQGRYLWRHNSVLRVISDGIQSFLQTNKVVSSGVNQIHFVRESGKTKEKKGRKPQFGILHKFSDFVMDVDLDRQLKYPSHIADSGLRPDIVLYSNSGRIVVHVELTCPIEENLQFAHSRKEKSYAKWSDLGMLCSKNGWQVVCFPVEVGARGYAGQSLNTCLRKLGLGRQRTKTVVRKAADEALRCSFWVWILRERQTWKMSTAFKENSSSEQDADNTTNNAPVYSRPKRKASFPLVPKTLPTNWVPKDLQRPGKVLKQNQDKINSKVPTVDKTPQPPSNIPFVGLINLGNTCYANSIMQAIAQLVDSSYCILAGMASEFSSLCSALCQKGNAIAPAKFLREFRELDVGFKKGKQHDASEFLTTLIQHIPYSLLGEDMQVENRSSRTCKMCGDTNSCDEPTYVVQVSYAASTLTRLVENYCQPDLAKTFPCPACKSKGHTLKQEEITNTPKYLVVAVKRDVSSKNISITQPLSPLHCNGVQYHLLSVVIHFGQDGAGHYITIRKDKEQWLMFDDDHVAEIQISRAESLAKSGYMFVFCR